jgi:cyclopropane fatty-acyl-phospholipid synthase-like methyltransferase
MAEGPPHWDDRYARGDLPWDTGCASAELQWILREVDVPRGRALELGCGTGTNAVFLAREGFEVTAFDVSATAIEQARAKAAEAGVEVTLLAADAAALPELGPPFPFVFDRGVYHTVRRDNLPGFLDTLSRVTAPGGLYLTLTGNANQVRPGEEGPPRVTAEEICRELTPLFDLVQLREFHFTQPPNDRQSEPALAWSALFRRPIT